MAALRSNFLKTNFKSSEITKEGLFVTRYDILDSLGGVGFKRIVYIFRRRKTVSYLLEGQS